jgi:hypothetical protein
MSTVGPVRQPYAEVNFIPPSQGLLIWLLKLYPRTRQVILFVVTVRNLNILFLCAVNGVNQNLVAVLLILVLLVYSF